MRTILRDNGLSLLMFGLFGLCLLGHSLTGYAAYRDDQQRPSATPPLAYTAYVTSSHFWASVYENTGRANFCRWPPTSSRQCLVLAAGLGGVGKTRHGPRGGGRRIPRPHRHDPQAPGPVRHGRPRARGSMPIPSPRALALLFVLALVGHAASGTHHYNREQRLHGQPPRHPAPVPGHRALLV